MVEAPVAPASPVAIDDLASIVVLRPTTRPRIRRVPWHLSRDPAFRRQYLSAGEVADPCMVYTGTVRKWVSDRGLPAVQLGDTGRLWIDRRDLATFLKTLPKPGTKTRARELRRRRLAARKRMLERIRRHSR